MGQQQALQQQQQQQLQLQPQTSAQLQQQLAQSAGGLGAGNQWQLDGEAPSASSGNQLAPQYDLSGPLRLARLEPSELANLESQLANGGELAELPAGGQFSAPLGVAPMDKREYIKPCSFNAISCVRTPFRKLK